MPSAAYVMKNWCVDMTWTPEPATYAPVTRVFKMKAAATNSAYVASAAIAATQDMTAANPVTLSAPYLGRQPAPDDPDQSW